MAEAARSRFDVHQRKGLLAEDNQRAIEGAGCILADAALKIGGIGLILGGGDSEGGQRRDHQSKSKLHWAPV